MIATPIRECVAVEPLVCCPRSTEQWVRAIETCAAERDAGAEERRAFASANTWDVRAEEAVGHLVERGLLRRPA